MKAIITFNCRLVIDIDDESRDDIVPENQQIERLKCIMMEECDCEHVDINEYHMDTSET